MLFNGHIHTHTHACRHLHTHIRKFMLWLTCSDIYRVLMMVLVVCSELESQRQADNGRKA